jgi:hypothetical protein
LHFFIVVIFRLITPVVAIVLRLQRRIQEMDTEGIGNDQALSTVMV